MSIFMPVQHYIDDYSFIVSFEIRIYKSSNFIFSFLIVSAVHGPIWILRSVHQFLQENPAGTLNL